MSHDCNLIPLPVLYSPNAFAAATANTGRVIAPHPTTREAINPASAWRRWDVMGPDTNGEPPKFPTRDAHRLPFARPR
jgi:hypothetical protein